MPDPLNREHFLAGYLAEVEDHLRAANQSLLALDQAIGAGGSQARPVRELFRALHTMKGLSAMVDVEPIVELSHAMETVLRAADRSGGRIGREMLERLIEGLAAIEQRAQAVAARRPVPPAPPELVARLQRAEAGAAPRPPDRAVVSLDPALLGKLSPSELDQLVQGVSEGRRAVRIDFAPTPARAERGLSITSIREAVSRLAEVVKVVPQGGAGGLVFSLIALTSADADALARAAGGPDGAVTPIEVGLPEPAAAEPAPEVEVEVEAADALTGAGGLRRDTVRVDVERLDDALDKLSALIVTRFRLARAVTALRERGVDVRDVSHILGEAGKELRDLRGAIMRARMVSVAELLERVPLIVRGLGQTTGRAARVRVDAGRAELDKAVAERIFPAIVHLVRNAVDHGLEPADERLRLGKGATGLISVTCFEHSDSWLELEVQDDGRGVDAAAVARNAGRPVPSSPAQLLELMVLPGLSTRAEASTTSGRGMGLDIVKRTVDALGGELLLRTTVGKGTTFTLRVPLSVSILDAFAFECGGQPFVVPVSVVEEIVDLAGERIFTSPTVDGGEGDGARLLRRRGRVMPVFDLRARFELPAGAAARPKAIVVRRRGESFAFEVDRMLGQQEVVIRPLEDPLVRVPGVTGSTDLGDGRPTLVLDLIALTGSPLVGPAPAVTA